MRAAIRILAGLLLFAVSFIVLSSSPASISKDAETMPYAQVIDVPEGVQDEVENIRRFCVDAPTDPLDRVLAVYTYFCLNYEYDYTCTYRGVDEIMESKTGLCEAYALAFRFVMDEFGIPCAYVEGDTPGVYHAWNAVQLDGQWYWLDPTFDDYKADGYRVNRQYFLKSDEVFLATHTPRLWYGPSGEREVQECPSTRFDAFWWNGDDVAAHDAVVPYDGGWGYFSRQADCLVKRGSAAENAQVAAIADDVQDKPALRVRGALLPLDDVEASPVVAGISIDGGDHTAPLAGEKLSASFSDGSTGSLPVVWTSSDREVADVQPDGRVVCKKPGQVTVKARTCDGSCEASIELTVPGFDTVAGREAGIEVHGTGEGTLSWGVVDGAVSYRVVLTPQTGGLRFMQHDIVQAESQATQLELVDMDARQDYYFEVHPVFEEGMGNTNILAVYHRGS